jgi:hypothetical protein
VLGAWLLDSDSGAQFLVFFSNSACMVGIAVPPLFWITKASQLSEFSVTPDGQVAQSVYEYIPCTMHNKHSNPGAAYCELSKETPLKLNRPWFFWRERPRSPPGEQLIANSTRIAAPHGPHGERGQTNARPSPASRGQRRRAGMCRVRTNGLFLGVRPYPH